MATREGTEIELALLLDELTDGEYSITDLKSDVANKISGKESGSLVEKIRLQTGKNLITDSRFMILFMRYWDFIDRELKGSSSAD